MRRRPIVISACYFAIAAGFAAPVFAVPNGLGFQDWDVHLFFYGAVLKNFAEYGQLPFWNPWYCGGNVLLQNPQVALLSPVYPLAAVVSLPLAMKISIVLHYWVGLVGMHLLLTRIIGLRFLPGVGFLASAFTLSGALAMHLAVGHANFLPAFYLPFLLYSFCRSLETGAIKHAIIGGAILALIVFNGGLHIVPMAAVLVGILGAACSAIRRDWRPITMASILGAVGMLLAAPKVVPILLFVSSRQFWDTRVPTGHPDLMTFEMLVRSFVDPYQTRGMRLGGQIHGWYEYGNYVGLPIVLAAAASVIWVLANRRIGNRWFGVSLAITTLLTLALTAGEFSAWAPGAIAAYVPPFSNFRIPSRYTIAALLCAVVTLGWAIKTLDLEGALLPRARIAASILCVLAAGDLALRNSQQLRGVFSQDPIDAHFRWLEGSDVLVTDAHSDPYQAGSPMYRALMKGESFYQCYEVMQVVHTADLEHALVSSDGQSKIFNTRFSPNRIDFTVAGGREPSRVRLNQNFAAGWHSDAGVVEPDPETGQPSVVLSPGATGKFSFTFVPAGLLLGFGLELVAIAASAYGWRRRFKPLSPMKG